MDIEASDLIVGLLTAALGLTGLFLASGARDIVMSLFGTGLAGWSVVFIFGLMRRHYDRIDVARAVARIVAHDGGRHE